MNLSILSELLEAVTILCFGLSWPISIRKSLVSGTAKGKSLFFEVFLLIGYAFGIARKVMQVAMIGSSGFVFFLSFFFYVLNFIEISIDVALYFRNSKLDRQREAGLEPACSGSRPILSANKKEKKFPYVKLVRPDANLSRYTV